MRLLKKYSLILAVCMGTLLGKYSYAVPGNECIDKLIKIQKKNNNIDSPQLFSVQLNTTIQYKEEPKAGNKTMKSVTYLEVGGGLMHLRNENMEYWQNSSEVLIVIPVQKIVVQGTISSDDNEYMKTAGSATLSDTLLKMAKVIKCTYSADSAGIKKQYILLALPEKLSQETNISSMEFWIDDVSQKVIKTKVDYRANYHIKNITTVYSGFTEKKVTKQKKYPIRQFVFDKQNKLLKKYSGYSVIDHGKK